MLRWRRTGATLIAFTGMVLLSSVAVRYVVRPIDGQKSDDGLGVMWTSIAAVFVYRTTIAASWSLVKRRLIATLIAAVLSMIYLVTLTQTVVGDAVVVALCAALCVAFGLDDELTVAAITAVVIVEASRLSSDPTWVQPVLRVIDTVLGVTVGLVFAGLDTRFNAAVRRGHLPR